MKRALAAFFPAMVLSGIVSCARAEAAAPTEANRQQTSSIATVEEFLQATRPHNLVFVGSHAEFDRLVQNAQSRGFKLLNDVMPGERAYNMVDDNEDGLIDNVHGWDVDQDTPYVPSFAQRVPSKVPLRHTPALTNEWLVVHPLLLSDNSTKLTAKQVIQLILALDPVGTTPALITNSRLRKSVLAILASTVPLNRYNQPVPNVTILAP